MSIKERIVVVDTEDLVRILITDIIRKANADGEVCKCGRILLDKKMTREILQEVTKTTLCMLAEFELSLLDERATLHLPDEDDLPGDSSTLH